MATKFVQEFELIQRWLFRVCQRAIEQVESYKSVVDPRVTPCEAHFRVYPRVG